MVISAKFLQFRTEVNNSVPYIAIPANTLRLEVTLGWNTKAAAKLADFELKWSAYASPSTHTDESATAIEASYNDMHPFMEKKKIVFKNNTEIVLEAADISNIYIHVDAPHRTHVAAVGFSPNNQQIYTVSS